MSLPGRNGIYNQDPGVLQEVDGKMMYDIQKDRRTPHRTLAIHSLYGSSVHAIVCLCWVCYLGVRLQTCIRATANSSDAHLWLCLLFLCEAILACPDIFQIVELSLWFVPSKDSAPRPFLRLNGNEAPMVHVLIATCGEDVEVIMDTVAGAAFQDYPKQCYRVFLLDDANDSELKRKVDDFNMTECTGLGAQPVVYLNRERRTGVSHYYKAGNLEFGIRTSDEQYGSSEYIAGLDADMIPESDWLKRLVPHLLCSPGLALVSPPQYCYNIPKGDILAQDANVLQHVLEPVRESVGCSMCHGSGYVMRRDALKSIGGWPQVNIGEDILCSYQLNRAGWLTAFVDEKVQFGLAPESFHAYVSQRIRWTAGNLLSAKRFKFFLPYLNRSNITAVQRFHGWMQAVKTYAWAALLFPVIALPACFAVLSSTDRYDEVFRDRAPTRYVYIILWVTFKLWKRTIFGQLGSTDTFNLYRNRLWITPYIVHSLYESHRVDLAETKFEISGTFESPINERSKKARPSLWRRMTDPLVLMHMVYCLIASGVLLTWVWALAHKTPSTTTSYGHSYTALTVRFLEIVMAALVPVRYMAFPPSAVNRRERLSKDETGTLRVIHKSWSGRGDKLLYLQDLGEILIMVLCDWL